MKKNKRNPHKFPVLQQDIRFSRDLNPPSSNKVRNEPINSRNENSNVAGNPQNQEQNNIENKNGGNFFDELINENRKEGETGTVNVEQQDQKKERKKLFTFKPDLLLDPTKGLKALYVNIDKFNLVKSENNQSNEDPQKKNVTNDKNSDEFHLLNKMMRLVKDWHFLCIPRYDFNYFLNRCQEFGTKPIIRSHLTRMRKIHKGLMRWEDLEMDQQDTAGVDGQQNSFVPQELLNNVQNRPHQNNAPQTNHVNLNNTETISQTQNLDQINNGINEIAINNNNDAPNYEEIMENDEDMNGMEIPAEVMNAPDVDIYDDDMDLEFYDLEREKKKVKTDDGASHLI